MGASAVVRSVVEWAGARAPPILGSVCGVGRGAQWAEAFLALGGGQCGGVGKAAHTLFERAGSAVVRLLSGRGHAHPVLVGRRQAVR